MAYNRRIRVIIFSSIILSLGIIHLGVGIGIVAKYHQFHDIFQQQVGLSGFNIVIGLFTIMVGVLGLVSVFYQYSLLRRITAVAAFILGIFAFVSLITALALSSRTASYLRDAISSDMYSYAQKEDSIDAIDKLQTTYECCGVNLWLDWSLVQLSASSGVGGRRRRRQISSSPVSPLIQALRQKRQTLTPNSPIYNLPTSYSINLPLSCCKNGGTTSGGNSLGGYCVFNSNGGASSFYLQGCLQPVSNIGFSQITGIAVINTCLSIFAFVYFGKLVKLFREDSRSNSEQPSQNGINQIQQQEQYPYEQYDTNNKQRGLSGINQEQQQQEQYAYGQYYMNNKQSGQNRMNLRQQQQQYPDAQYYLNNNNPNPYFIYNEPIHTTYH